MINGQDNFNQNEITEDFAHYFSTLFKEAHPWRPPLDTTTSTKISVEEQAWLERPIDESEVWQTIKRCGRNMSPGPDGFPLEFYKVAWPVIKTDVMAEIQEFHEAEKNGVK